MRFETMANLRRHQKYHDRFDKQVYYKLITYISII